MCQPELTALCLTQRSEAPQRPSPVARVQQAGQAVQAICSKLVHSYTSPYIEVRVTFYLVWGLVLVPRMLTLAGR